MKTATLMTAFAMVFSQAAFALTDAEEYADLTSKAKITLNQASDAAAAKVSGQAVKAEIESQRGEVIYEVDVLVGTRLYNVDVNGVDGTILNVKEDLD